MKGCQCSRSPFLIPQSSREGKKLVCGCTARSRAGPRIQNSINNASCLHSGKPHLLARDWAGPGANPNVTHTHISPFPPPASLPFLEGATVCQDSAKRSLPMTWFNLQNKIRISTVPHFPMRNLKIQGVQPLARGHGSKEGKLGLEPTAHSAKFLPRKLQAQPPAW